MRPIGESTSRTPDGLKSNLQAKMRNQMPWKHRSGTTFAVGLSRRKQPLSNRAVCESVRPLVTARASDSVFHALTSCTLQIVITITPVKFDRPVIQFWRRASHLLQNKRSLAHTCYHHQQQQQQQPQNTTTKHNKLEFGMYPQSMPTEWTHARALRPWQSVRLDLWRLVLRGL